MSCSVRSQCFAKIIVDFEEPDASSVPRPDLQNLRGQSQGEPWIRHIRFGLHDAYILHRFIWCYYYRWVPIRFEFFVGVQAMFAHWRTTCFDVVIGITIVQYLRSCFKVELCAVSFFCWDIIAFVWSVTSYTLSCVRIRIK